MSWDLSWRVVRVMPYDLRAEESGGRNHDRAESSEQHGLDYRPANVAVRSERCSNGTSGTESSGVGCAAAVMMPPRNGRKFQGVAQREKMPEKRLVRRRTRDIMLTLYGSDSDACRTLLTSALEESLGVATLASSSSREMGYGETGEDSPLAGKK